MTKKNGKPTAQPRAQQPAPKPYIVFGADEYARPRAARFLTTEIEPLQMAATAMNARLFEVNSPELAAIMKTLPAGRLHASGDGFLPYVKGPDVLGIAVGHAAERMAAAGFEPEGQGPARQLG